MNKPVTIQLDEETLRGLDRLAQVTNRSREELIDEAIKRLVDYDAWFVREVEKGIADADAGRLVSHEEVMKEARERIARTRK